MKKEFIIFLEQVLTDISEQCLVCPFRLTCLEDECTLFNIEIDILEMIDRLEDKK